MQWMYRELQTDFPASSRMLPSGQALAHVPQDIQGSKNGRNLRQDADEREIQNALNAYYPPAVVSLCRIVQDVFRAAHKRPLVVRPAEKQKDVFQIYLGIDRFHSDAFWRCRRPFSVGRMCPSRGNSNSRYKPRRVPPAALPSVSHSRGIAGRMLYHFPAAFGFHRFKIRSRYAASSRLTVSNLPL